MTAAPFSEPSYDLGAGVALGPLPPATAAALGPALAAIDPWARYPYPARGLTDYLAEVEPGAPRFVVTVDGRVAGAVGLRLRWLRGPYIQLLAVLPAFQGRAVGARVLAWIEAEARRGGERNLWVAASDFNAGALRFYARCGFAETARLDGLVRDGRTEVLLRKRLA